MNELRDLQLKELEILNIFVAICEKHKLKYFLSDGTLLGAIRHQGFIPWDDDVDVAMPRADYNKFLEIAEKELPNDFFLQHYKKEKGLPFLYAKIRNSNTYIKEVALHKTSYHQGIFIDIFPFDNCPDEPKEFKKFVMKLNLLYFILVCDLKSQSTIRNILKIFARPIRFIISKQRILSIYDKQLQKYNKVETNKVSQLTVPNFGLRVVYEKDIIFPLVKTALFEDKEYSIVNDYDKYLTTLYNDYLELPPVDKQVPLHGLTYDLHKSYREYIKNK